MTINVRVRPKLNELLTPQRAPRPSISLHKCWQLGFGMTWVGVFRPKEALHGHISAMIAVKLGEYRTATAALLMFVSRSPWRMHSLRLKGYVII